MKMIVQPGCGRVARRHKQAGQAMTEFVVLTGLLFSFGIEQRRTEVGTLLALGFTAKRVRNLLLCEGVSLALIGAARSFGGQPARPDTSVYLTSGRGDMEMTAEVMIQLYRDGMPPRPLSFINTVSNSACFYIAKQFALRGRSSSSAGWSTPSGSASGWSSFRRRRRSRRSSTRSVSTLRGP